jgi:prevent-host-death family protein
MKEVHVSEAANNLSHLIKDANQEQKKYRISSEEGACVLMPEEMYENILVTLELLSHPGLLDGVRRQEEVASNLE